MSLVFCNGTMYVNAQVQNKKQAESTSKASPKDSKTVKATTSGKKGTTPSVATSTKSASPTIKKETASSAKSTTIKSGVSTGKSVTSTTKATSAKSVTTPTKPTATKAVTTPVKSTTAPKIEPVKPVVQPASTSLTAKQKQNYIDMVPSTARLLFVDSIVVPISKLTESLPLAPSSGNIQITKSANGKFNNYTYTNEFGNRRILSLTDSKGVHNLYIQELLGSGWEKPTLVKLEGGLTDLIRPYIMPDGITLYFSAKGGEDNVGGYDLYYTVLDTETHKFLRPQSLGLPYNSPNDDLYCIINDIDSLGYLVTTRRQPAGKCCIYTFVPTESREIYDATNVTSTKLSNFAALNRIADTQKDKKVLAEARQRLKNRRTKSAISNANDIDFKITSGLVYHNINQFVYPADVELFKQYKERKSALEIQEQQLEALRIAYHDGDISLANSILAFESSTESERNALSDLFRIIRNNEILELQKKQK